MGSFEEEGELQARARARGAVRSLHVHVPTARAWRLQVGQGTDPGVRYLRRVHSAASPRGLRRRARRRIEAVKRSRQLTRSSIRDSGLRRFGHLLYNLNVNADERGHTRRFGATSATTG